MILRIIRHIIVLLTIKLPLQLLGMIVLAIYLPFHGKDEILPYWLKWFDNAGIYLNGGVYEEYITDGLSGGPSYRRQWSAPTGFLARYTWLACRNPLNYFQTFILGYGSNQYSEMLRPEYTNIENLDKPGHDRYNYTVELTNGVWEVSRHYKLAFDKYLTIRLGYKIVHIHEDSTVEIALVSSKLPAQWVFSIGIRS